jgi:LysM repeat protein
MGRFRVAVVAASLVVAVAGCGGAPNGATTSAGASPSATSGVSPSASVPTATPRPSRVTPSATAKSTAKPSAKPTPHGTTYVVKTGDTLYAIAVRFKVTVAQILVANPSITDPTKITIGQKIIIPKP